MITERRKIRKCANHIKTDYLKGSTSKFRLISWLQIKIVSY